MHLIIVFISVVLICFILRAVIFYGSKGYGCDVFYFLTCRRNLIKNKKLPIILHNYLLDIEEQWYPPLFTLLLCLIPEKVLHKYHWLLNPIIDCIHALLLMAVVFFITDDIWCTLIAGIFYSTSPALIVESTSMNVRPLTSILFSSCLLFLYVSLSSKSMIFMIVTILLCGLLMLTHKLSIQGIVPILMLLSIMYKTAVPLILFIVSVLVVYILTGGFYKKILRGHIDILKFWRRNLHNLGAHQWYDSSLYAKPHTSTLMYKKGITGILKLVKIIGGYNPLIILLVLIIFLDPRFVFTNTTFARFCFLWITGIYAVVCVTVFIPMLRFLGEGWKYIKYAVFPSSVFIALWCVMRLYTMTWYTVSLIGCFAIISSGMSIVLIVRMRKSLTMGQINQSFMEMLEFIRENNIDRIMCVPTHLCDAVVYYCDKKVLWGTHNSNYETVEEFFPVIKKPVEYFIQTYQLQAVLINKNYFSLDIFKNNNVLYQSGEYILYNAISQQEVL